MKTQSFQAQRRAKPLEWGLVALLTVVTLLARQSGLDCLLPGLLEPDSNVTFQVRSLEVPELSPQLDWQFGSYPLLVARSVQLLPQPSRSPKADQDREQWLAAASAEHVRARRAVSIWSTALVPLTWRLASNFVSPPFALAAAALSATSLLATSFAQQARPHGPVAAAILLCVILSIRFARNPRLWNTLLLLGSVVASVGVLHNGIAALGPAFVAVWCAVSRWRARIGLWLAVLASAALSVLTFYPALFSDDPTVGGTKLEESGLRQGEHIINWSQFNGRGLLRMWDTLWRYEIVALAILILGLVGVCLHWFQRRERADTKTSQAAWIAAAFALPYLGVVGAFEATAERFLLPGLPFAYVLGVSGLERLAGARGRRAALAGLVLALGFAGFVSSRMLLLRSRTSTVEQACQWLRENAAPGERVLANPGLDLPLFSTREALTMAMDRIAFGYPLITNWTRFQARARLKQELEPVSNEPRLALEMILPVDFLPPDVDRAHALLESKAPAFVVVESEGSIYQRTWMIGLGQALPGAALLQARFDPGLPDGEPMLFEDQSHPQRWHGIARTLRAKCYGPQISIWKLNAPASAASGE